MSDYRHWTSDEEKYIQDHWRLQTDGEMAAALDRSEGAVRTKRRELRCSPQKTWTPEELQYLEDHWGTVSIPGIAKKLGRTVNAIKVRVARMGLGGMLNSGDYVTFNVQNSGKKLQRFCFYCLATPRIKKIGTVASWTGTTPPWCPKGRG